MNKFYPSLDELVIALNAFASLQEYAMVKKSIKTSKKKVLQKAILIYNRDKKHINTTRGK